MSARSMTWSPLLSPRRGVMVSSGVAVGVVVGGGVACDSGGEGVGHYDCVRVVGTDNASRAITSSVIVKASDMAGLLISWRLVLRNDYRIAGAVPAGCVMR